MTRIVVGCDKHVDTGAMRTHQGGAADELVSKNKLIRSTFPNLNVHFAPSIPEAKEFPWYNKPWSFHHWVMKNPPKETAICILDPDEFFFEPLTQTKKKRSGLMSNWPKNMEKDITNVVRPGMGVAQMYGFGTVWLNMFDRKTLCPGKGESPCAKMDQDKGWKYYPVGPPYMFHRDDFLKVMPTWWDLMKPVYAQDKGDIQADMYAYVYAAIHHNVKHTVLYNYMVSNVDEGYPARGEAWDWVDSIKTMSCHNPEFPEGAERPGFVHCAGHYKACSNGDEISYNTERCPTKAGGGGELWNWHKGHVPAQILECEHPLLMPPPDSLFNVNAGVVGGGKASRRGKRTSFMMCHLTFLVNRAALDYKKKFCDPGYETRKCTRIVTSNPPRGQKKNPHNYPLAFIDQKCMAAGAPVYNTKDGKMVDRKAGDVCQGCS